MSTALKAKVPSGADEFELPDSLSPIVEDLKKEQQTIKKEIEEVKSRPVVRKQDESTRVFNLRQHQIELKIQELEEKKKTTERELQEITQKKNSTLHTDLKKLAQFLLLETRKVSSKIDAVSNIRNELQNICEANLNDRKKTLGMIEEQNQAISLIGDVVRDTSRILQSEFHFLTKDIERIHREKETEIQKLSSLKEEVSRNQGLYEVIEKRKTDLRKIEDQISLAEKNALAFARLDEELFSLKSEIQKLQNDKESLLKETHRLQVSQFESQENVSRLKHLETELQHSFSGKKAQLTALESDIHEARKRVESIRNLELEVMSQYNSHREQVTHLQSEITKAEAARTTHLLMADEAQSFFEERKAYYKRELDHLEASNESRKAELESRNEMRKLQWETEFKTYTEARQSELAVELEAQDRKDLEDIRNKKKILLEEISNSVTAILNAEGFQSTEERARKARKDTEKIFEQMFGKTRRWKFW